MILISPFTPIFFPEKHSDGLPCRYVQTFAATDSIVLEIFADATFDARLVNEETSEKTEIAFDKIELDTYDLYVAKFTIATDGIYHISLEDYGTSEPFRVTSKDNELALTTLITYSNVDNTRRKDAMFLLGEKRLFFNFRVPGGFKHSNYTFAIDNEQFETRDCDIIELYGVESTQKKFTLGGQLGTPIWFGELLNRLLCCNYVYFNGYRYARKGTSVPEITTLHEGIDAFVFNVTVQRIHNSYPKIEMLLND